METFHVDEQSTPVYTGTLQDENGTVIPKSDVTSLKLTYYNLDDSTQPIINSRNGVDALTMLHATSGLITWTLATADTTLKDTTRATELNRARFDFIYSGGTKTGRHEFNVRVRNLNKLT